MPTVARPDPSAAPLLSIVIPVFNERENIVRLLEEIAAVPHLPAHEVLCVDDCSDDDTLPVLLAARSAHPRLRVLAHRRRSGQSAAVRSGVKAARGAWIATLDGDGQNDPADIPTLLAARGDAAPGVRLFAGWRTQRKDSGSKRWASRWANRIRASLLRDATPDTGCGIKLFEREAFLDLPAFDHMHRYLPALMQRAGWQTLSVPVGHRPRVAGVSKYNNLARAWVGVSDLAGVLWLLRRGRIAAAGAVETGAIDGLDEPRDRRAGLDRPAHDAVETDRPDRRADVRGALAGAVPRLP